MDLGVLMQVRSEEWDRLDRLARQRTLSGAEADELVRLYQSAATDLSTIQSVAPDNDVAIRLSSIVSRARTRFTGQSQGAFAGIGEFFTRSLPLGLHRLRWVFAGVAIAFFGMAVCLGLWIGLNPDVLAAVATPEEQQQLANQDFAAYYSENPSGVFALGLFTNNAWIALTWVVLGITGYWVVYGLIINALNLGLVAGIMHGAGAADTFWLYILPHGLPEMTCILIAAAAGLRIFWAWVSPGPMLRRTAVAREARSLLVVGLGLVLMLGLSALVEAFVTPSTVIPHPVRIGIGVLFVAGIAVYAGTLGRRAERAGESGDLRREHIGEEQRTSG